MVVDPHWWLGYLGQSLAKVIYSTTHEQAVDEAASRLEHLVEEGPLRDEHTLNKWRTALKAVQPPGPEEGEGDV